MNERTEKERMNEKKKKRERDKRKKERDKTDTQMKENRSHRTPFKTLPVSFDDLPPACRTSCAYISGGKM